MQAQELENFHADFLRAKKDMKELTNQISEQDLQIEELKQRLHDKDNVIKDHLQAIENAKNELRKQKEKNAKMDDENFKSKMAQLEQLE